MSQAASAGSKTKTPAYDDINYPDSHGGPAISNSTLSAFPVKSTYGAKNKAFLSKVNNCLGLNKQYNKINPGGQVLQPSASAQKLYNFSRLPTASPMGGSELSALSTTKTPVINR